MWVQTQRGDLVNLDHALSINIETTGNNNGVAQILSNGTISNGTYEWKHLLGEYRFYAAKEIIKQIGLCTCQNNLFVMPNEQEANEKYKNEVDNRGYQKGKTDET